MIREPAELREVFINTGSVTINDTIIVKEKYPDKYGIFAECELNLHKSRLYREDTVPDESDFQTYIDATETIDRWEEEGYQDVGEWDHLVKNGHHDWETPEGNYVRISTSRPSSCFKTSNTAELFIHDLLGASSSERKVDISSALFLNSMSPREFDYKYNKYKSMYENLTQLHGIGNKVATELIEEMGCETYLDAKQSIWRTNIPSVHLEDAEDSIQECIETGGNQLLFDASIRQEYSDVVVSKNI